MRAQASRTSMARRCIAPSSGRVGCSAPVGCAAAGAIGDAPGSASAAPSATPAPPRRLRRGKAGSEGGRRDPEPISDGVVGWLLMEASSLLLIVLPASERMRPERAWGRAKKVRAVVQAALRLTKAPDLPQRVEKFRSPRCR